MAENKAKTETKNTATSRATNMKTPFFDDRSISIIIAAYNEEKSIAMTLSRVAKLFPNAEIIIVNDGSKDKTADVVNSLKKKPLFKNVKILSHYPNKGKGYAMQVGVKAAKKPIQVQLDADCQFPPESIPDLVKPISDGRAEITFASRFLSGSFVEKGSLTGIRRIANYVVSLLTSILAGQRLSDVNAGFKAWTSKSIMDIDFKCNHFAYEPEIAILAKKKNYRILEVPIRYSGRQGGITSVKLIRDGIIIPLYLLKVKIFR